MVLPLFWVLVLVAGVHSTLTILSPPELIAKFNTVSTTHTIPYSIANFGFIPYGKELRGQVVVANPMTNCQLEDDVADDNQLAISSRFLLILRGDCSFVTKVRNAQGQFAKLAIIMDNSTHSGQIIMKNDGYSSDIEIPSVFISQDDGDTITSFISANPSVSVQFSVKFPTNKTDQANITLFSDINNRASYIFIRKLEKYLQPISSQINFKIYHHYYSCYGALCNDNDCFPNSNMCAFPPVNQAGPASTGLDVINQSLREHFATDFGLKGLKYISLIDEYCLDYGSMKECSNLQLGKVGINKNRINQLVDEQYSKDPKGSVISDALEMQNQNKVIFYPDILINQVTYYGQLDALDVFEMICNSLNSPPQQCSSYVENYSPVVQKSSLGGWAIMGIVVGSLVVFFLVMICVVRRVLRRRVSGQMNQEINQLVNHYISSYETKRIQSLSQAISEVEESK